MSSPILSFSLVDKQSGYKHQVKSMHHDDDGAPRPRGGQGLLAGLLHQLLGQRRVEEVVEHLLVLGQVVGGVDG